MTSDSVTVGVLALQGAFREHIILLKKIGVETIEVRLPEHFSDIDGLVIPGGESTTMAIISGKYDISQQLKQWVEEEKPTFGTCAGMILLAKDLIGKKLPDQVTLNAIDIEVHRNFFGSQLGSFMAPLCGEGETETDKYMFIRAPIVSKIHSTSVKVLATVKRSQVSSLSKEGEDFDEVIVAVCQGNFLAISFHPELTGNDKWHRRFVEMIRDSKSQK